MKKSLISILGGMVIVARSEIGKPGESMIFDIARELYIGCNIYYTVPK